MKADDLLLFWCSTESGDADYWVVAESALAAQEFFGMHTGFEPIDVQTELIFLLTNDDDVDPITRELSPCFPVKTQLELWGVMYNSSFHVFHFDGRIFRPEGLARALMVSNARVALLKRLRGRKQKTTYSL